MDAGSYFSEQKPEENLINEFMVEGLRLLGTDLVNLTMDDLPHLAFVKVIDKKKNSQDPFISANIRSKSKEIPDPRPYVIKTITGPKIARKQGIKVGFVGLADNEKTRRYAEGLFEVADPLAVAKKIAPEVKSQCDLLVVLTDIPRKKAVRMAVQNSDIDLIIAAVNSLIPGEPEMINNATLLVPANQGRYLGELRLYLDEQGRVARVQNRHVILDDKVPDEPEIQKAVEATRATINEFNRTFAQNQPLINNVSGSEFVGAETCGQCHAPAYDIWKKTGHAHALDTLKAKNSDFNANCLPCHTTGFGWPGGFINAFQTPKMADVQCEMCHGPGLSHVQNPKPGYGKAGSQSCLRCHTSHDSPNFDFVKYWERIKH